MAQADVMAVPVTTSLFTSIPLPTLLASLPYRVFPKEHFLNKLQATKSLSQALLLENMDLGH